MGTVRLADWAEIIRRRRKKVTMAERESRVILIALISMLASYLLENQLCLRADVEEIAAHLSL